MHIYTTPNAIALSSKAISSESTVSRFGKDDTTEDVKAEVPTSADTKALRTNHDGIEGNDAPTTTFADGTTTDLGVVEDAAVPYTHTHAHAYAHERKRPC